MPSIPEIPQNRRDVRTTSDGSESLGAGAGIGRYRIDSFLRSIYKNIDKVLSGGTESRLYLPPNQHWVISCMAVGARKRSLVTTHLDLLGPAGRPSLTLLVVRHPSSRLRCSTGPGDRPAADLRVCGV